MTPAVLLTVAMLLAGTPGVVRVGCWSSYSGDASSMSQTNIVLAFLDFLLDSSLSRSLPPSYNLEIAVAATTINIQRMCSFRVSRSRDDFFR